MVVDESISSALNRIADQLEENNDVLKRIANHYDGVVPVMTRNANRVEKAHMEVEEDNRSPLDKMYEGLFRPQEN
tara:strand:+ start:150 stop:374 length:225 start_codon:yes stop_codon:yes gene_type:complete